MVLTEEERKERKRIRNEKYRKNHKEEIKIINKKYRESDNFKKIKESNEYKEKRKKQSKKQSEKRSLKRKEIREQKKIEKELNKELDKLKYNERKLNYTKTENGKKTTLKATWKYYGLNMENFEEIYERYINAIFCDICECVLEGNGRNKKCMDHDHDTGEFRNIVCNYCNIHICK